MLHAFALRPEATPGRHVVDEVWSASLQRIWSCRGAVTQLAGRHGAKMVSRRPLRLRERSHREGAVGLLVEPPQGLQRHPASTPGVAWGVC